MFTNKYRSDIQKMIDLKFSAYATSPYDFFVQYEDNGKPKSDLIYSQYKDFDTIVNDFFIKLIGFLKSSGRYNTIAGTLEFINATIEFFKRTSVTKNEIPKTVLEKYERLRILEESEFNLLVTTVKAIKKHYISKYIPAYNDLRDDFAKDMIIENGIHICPYCRRNYVNVVTREGDSIFHIKPDLDHFYPKAYYPFLAITLENLIPACQTCNSRLKKEKDFFMEKHNHPLQDGENIFEILKFSYIGVDQTIYVTNKHDLNAKESKTLETFRIEEVYNSHKEILEGLRNKYKRYNEVKKMALRKMLPTLTESVILDLIFYEYRHMDKTKEPLYKLKKDLYESIVK